MRGMVGGWGQYITPRAPNLFMPPIRLWPWLCRSPNLRSMGNVNTRLYGRASPPVHFKWLDSISQSRYSLVDTIPEERSYSQQLSISINPHNDAFVLFSVIPCVMWTLVFCNAFVVISYVLWRLISCDVLSPGIVLHMLRPSLSLCPCPVDRFAKTHFMDSDLPIQSLSSLGW